MPRSLGSAKKPRSRYHHGNLRRALLDQALATIRAQGVEGLTLREIGAQLGVSRTALYRHFADKGALLEAVATEGFRTLRLELVSAWDGGSRGLDGFRAMGMAYVHFAVASPSHYRVMFGGFVDPDQRQPELATEATGAFQALVDALIALQRGGLVRGDDTQRMASFVWSVVHGVAMLAMAGKFGEPVAVEAIAQYAVERVQAGIAAEPPSPTP